MLDIQRPSAANTGLEWP